MSRITWDWATKRLRTCLHCAMEHGENSFGEYVFVSNSCHKQFCPLHSTTSRHYSGPKPGLISTVTLVWLPCCCFWSWLVQNYLLKVTPEINGCNKKRAQMSLISVLAQSHWAPSFPSTITSFFQYIGGIGEAAQLITCRQSAADTKPNHKNRTSLTAWSGPGQQKICPFDSTALLDLHK